MIVAQTTTKDTICGMTVNLGTAIHADRDGETFYFCSDHCRQKFLFKTAAVKPEEKSAAAADTTVKRDTKAGAPASGKTMIAGAAMSLSSVSVIGNALRLRNVKMGASQI